MGHRCLFWIVLGKFVEHVLFFVAPRTIRVLRIWRILSKPMLPFARGVLFAHPFLCWTRSVFWFRICTHEFVDWTVFSMTQTKVACQNICFIFYIQKRIVDWTKFQQTIYSSCQLISHIKYILYTWFLFFQTFALEKGTTENEYDNTLVKWIHYIETCAVELLLFFICIEISNLVQPAMVRELTMDLTYCSIY